MLRENGIERRRTIRINRSSLIRRQLEGIDRPSMKIAETRDELEQAFRIIYDAYRESNYIQSSHPSKMAYNIYSLLPTTCVFVFKQYLTVISTASYIPDTPTFGLPMDSLYKPELDALRNQGRKIAEIGALATPRNHRWNSLVVYIAKALFQYAYLTDVDDVCIMVNPKHVRFYKEIFLFEEYAEERMYDVVGAPAVALRADVHTYQRNMEDAYGHSDFDGDLLAFFTKVNNTILDPNIEYPVERRIPLDLDTARYFFTQRPELFDTLTEEQRYQLLLIYHKVFSSEGWNIS